jgi:hypothetical protein
LPWSIEEETIMMGTRTAKVQVLVVGALVVVTGCAGEAQPLGSAELAFAAGGGQGCLSGQGGGPPGVVVSSFAQGAAYSGATDATISKASPTTNYENSAVVVVDGGSAESAALLRWDTTSIASSRDVIDAQIQFEITNTSPTAVFDIRWLLASWTEAQVTWQKRNLMSNWNLAGAKGTGDVAPVSVGSFAASQLGIRTICLNSSGVSMVQGWVSNPAANNGILFRNPSATNGIHIASSQSAAFRPRLTIRHIP